MNSLTAEVSVMVLGWFTQLGVWRQTTEIKNKNDTTETSYFK